EEQARVGRELHDIIAHTLSVIVVQAAAAGDVFDSRPDQARQALGSIEATGRQALAELRRVLAAIRPPTPPPPPPPPPPPRRPPGPRTPARPSGAARGGGPPRAAGDRRPPRGAPPHAAQPPPRPAPPGRIPGAPPLPPATEKPTAMTTRVLICDDQSLVR